MTPPDKKLYLVRSRCGGGKTNEALKNIKEYTIYAVPTNMLFDSIQRRSKQKFIAVNSVSTNKSVSYELVSLIVKNEKFILCTHEGVSRLMDQNVDLSRYNLIIDEQPKMVEIFAHAYTSTDAQYVRGLVRQEAGVLKSGETEEDLTKKITDIESGKNTNSSMLSLYRGLYGATYDERSYASVVHVHDTSSSFALGVISYRNFVEVSNHFKTVTIMTADDIQKGIGCFIIDSEIQTPHWASSLEQQYTGQITVVQLTDKTLISKTAMDKVSGGKTIREHMVDVCNKFNAKIMINNSYQHLVANPLPVISHGLNDWSNEKAIGCVYSAMPDPLLVQALDSWNSNAKQAWIQTNHIDVIHQALARGNMRNNGEQVCLVPDAKTAEYIMSRCRNAKLDLSHIVKIEDKSGSGSKENVGAKKKAFALILGDKTPAFNKWWSKKKSKGLLSDKDELNPKHLHLANAFKIGGGRGATTCMLSDKQYD